MEKAANGAEYARLCALLRDTRESAGLRQVDVAEALGVPQSYVSKYESGERRLDLIELREVCRAIGTTLVDFVTRFQARTQASTATES